MMKDRGRGRARGRLRFRNVRASNLQLLGIMIFDQTERTTTGTGIKGQVKYRGSETPNSERRPGIKLISRSLSAVRTHSGPEWKPVGGSAKRRIGGGQR